ncbi:hypothetical protein VPHD479_0308 [Vibrio phage D479]
MNLKQLMEEQRNSGIITKGKFPKCHFSSDVPGSLICAWKNHVEAESRLLEEVQWAFEELDKRETALSDPLQWLGKRIQKKSDKPFKGGCHIVKAIGIIPHPQLPGELAFEYEYDAGRHIEKSYCRISQVKPLYADFY